MSNRNVCVIQAPP